MQSQISDFRGLMGLWPTLDVFGNEVTGEPRPNVTNPGRIWSRRNRVPRAYWPRLITLAQSKGVSLNDQQLEAFWAQGNSK